MRPAPPLLPLLLLLLLRGLPALPRARPPADLPRACPPSFFDAGAACERCPARLFSLAPTFRCTACPPGHGSSPGAACAPCPPAFYSPHFAAAPCLPCPPRTFSAAAASACHACPPPPDPPDPHASPPAHPACATCPPGRFWARVADAAQDCLPCPPGSFSDVPDARACTACPAGFFQPTGDAFEHPGAAACTPCPPGFFAPHPGAAACAPCPPAEYQPRPAATACTPCPPGTADHEDRAHADGQALCRSACEQPAPPACLACPPAHGRDPAADKCAPCPDGAVSPGGTETECVVCDARLGQRPNSARTRCRCIPGLLETEGEFGQLVCRECPDGADAPEGTECRCTGGRFMHPAGFCDCKPGHKLVRGICTPCHPDELAEAPHPDDAFDADDDDHLYGDDAPYVPPPEEDEEEEGGGDDDDDDDDDDDEDDDEHHYLEAYVPRNECALCGPGFGAPSKGACCQQCANGTANPLVNLRACPACPAPQVAVDDATRCACPPGTRRTASGCEPCPPGTRSLAPRPTCEPCHPGEFSPDAASLECQPCPPGTDSPAAAARCVPACPWLAHRADDGACRCDPNAIQVASDPLRCEQCPGILLANAARTACVCSPGYAMRDDDDDDDVCRLCAPGTFSVGGDAPCQKCEVQTATSIEGQAYSCHPCEEGTEAPWEGMVNCVPVCEEGSFRAAGEGGGCLKCATGERMLDRVCVPCVEGSVSNGGAQAYCELCEGDLVPDEDGERCVRKDGGIPCGPGTRREGDACVPCPAGSYSEGEDVEECALCPTGTFRAQGGGDECELCAEGTVATEEGSVKCNRCPEGTYQDGVGAIACLVCAEGRAPNRGRTGCEWQR